MGAADVLLPTQIAGSANFPLVVAIKGEASSALATTGGASAAKATASAVTRVAVNVANVTLKAANAARLGLTVFNNSAASNLFLKLGAAAAIGAGVESFTIKITPGFYYEVPYSWVGIVDGIWDAADAAGEALVTELT